MTVKYTTRVTYFHGSYDASRPEFTTEFHLNKDGISVVAQFLPESCVLKLFKLSESNSVQIVDELHPYDVLDLGIAQVTQNAVDRTNQQGISNSVSVSNISGHGDNNIIFVFESPKESKQWCHVVKEAQENLGIDAPRAEASKKISQKNTHYCTELAQFCDEFGVRSVDVLKEKIAEVDKKKEEIELIISHNERQLELKTGQIQSRDFQIKVKEKDVAALKAELEAGKPRHQYKYIIPYRETKEKTFGTCSEQACIKLARNRATRRKTAWKIYDDNLAGDSVVTDMLRLAKLDSAKHGTFGG